MLVDVLRAEAVHLWMSGSMQHAKLDHRRVYDKAFAHVSVRAKPAKHANYVGWVESEPWVRKGRSAWDSEPQCPLQSMAAVPDLQ